VTIRSVKSWKSQTRGYLFTISRRITYKRVDPNAKGAYRNAQRVWKSRSGV